jgi:hypothetical protein
MTADDHDSGQNPAVSPAEVRGLDSADATQAAAVAVAIGAHLRDRAVSAGTDSTDREEWIGRKWAFADRLDRRRDHGVRIPRRTPTDPWTAADRTDRL